MHYSLLLQCVTVRGTTREWNKRKGEKHRMRGKVETRIKEEKLTKDSFTAFPPQLSLVLLLTLNLDKRNMYLRGCILNLTERK